MRLAWVYRLQNIGVLLRIAPADIDATAKYEKDKADADEIRHCDPGRVIALSPPPEAEVRPRTLERDIVSHCRLFPEGSLT